MKVALVHELLTIRGGAERVLKILADMFPEAPIYTLLYDEVLMGDLFPASRVRVSEVQKFAKLSKNHHLYLKRFPHAVEAWDFSEFDLVISSSSAFAHGIITNGKPLHLSYIHSPARYLWDRTHDILDRAGKGPLGWLRGQYLSKTFHELRIWDSEAADRADGLIAASKEIQRRIELYWRRNSEVIYPPISDRWFEPATPPAEAPYFLVVSTLADYKRVDIAIKACEAAGVRLKIAGQGRALPALKKIAGSRTEFLGYQNDAQLRSLYTGAVAVIFPGDEDFGLVPLESMACGTPVIAYRAGGALETIVEGVTGAFFGEQTPESLAAVLNAFDAMKFSKKDCIEHAKKFSESEFTRALTAKIAAMTTLQQ